LVLYSRSLIERGVRDRRWNASGDVEAALLPAFHQPLRREPIEGLANRAVAGRVAVAHELDPQLLPGREPAGENVAAQALVDRGRDRSQGHAVGTGFSAVGRGRPFVGL
jgi:hypothetical protein